GLIESYLQLLVLRGIGGVGSAMFTISAQSVLVNRIPSAVRGRAMSVWSGSFLLGGVLGPVIGAPLIAISLRAPFFFYAATLAVRPVVTVAALPRARRRPGGTAAATPDDVTAAEDDNTGPTEGLAVTLRLPLYRIVLLGSVARRLATSARSTLVPLFVVEALYLSDSWSGYALAIA